MAYDVCQLDRRAQYLVAGSNVAPASTAADLEGAEDTEEGPALSDEEAFDTEQDVETPRPADNDSFVGPFAWEDDYDRQTVDSSITTDSQRTARLPVTGRDYIRPIISSPPVEDAIQEETPLLSRKVSFSTNAAPAKKASTTSLGATSYRATASGSGRRLSTTSLTSVKEVQRQSSGHSTFGQTVCFLTLRNLLQAGLSSIHSFSTPSQSFWGLACSLSHSHFLMPDG